MDSTYSPQITHACDVPLHAHYAHRQQYAYHANKDTI